MTSPTIDNTFKNNFNITLDLDVDTEQISKALYHSLKNKELKININVDLSKYERVFIDNINIFFKILLILLIAYISIKIINEMVLLCKRLFSKRHYKINVENI